MELGLKDKVAFIAGSSRGIGKAIASAFLQEGAKTVITGRDKSSLEETRKSLAGKSGEHSVLAIEGDLGLPDDLARAFDQTKKLWGRIDCVVVNIGTGKSVPGWNLVQKDWNAAFDQNFWPSVRIATQAMELMAANDKGSIVFIASITGVEQTAAPLAYSAAKAALINYAGNLSRLAAKHHIRVNCIAPGNVLFSGGSWEGRLKEKKEEVLGYLQAEVPQDRFGTPEEIADVVTFISSDRASFVTGACWTVDGGQTRAF